MRPTCAALILVAALFAVAADARAQQTPPSASLSPEQKAGEKLFLQRCSVCHLGSAPTYKPYGPSLAGVVETAGEVQVRTTILSGLPGMPGWRYSLDGTQVDTVIAYIRTLKKR
jgi:mono/diheme cytochrome c family protein